MRIVVLSQWFPPEKAALPADVAHAAAARGHDVTVLTGFPNYPTGQIYNGYQQRARLDAEIDGLHVRRVALYPSHDRNAGKRVANYLSFAATSTAFGWRILRSADAVYVYHPPLTASLGPWLARSLRGAPYVLHVQDLWPESVLESGLLSGRAVGAVGRLLTRACNAAYRRAAVVIGIAPTMAELLRERGVPADRLAVVPNWADEEIFYPVPRDEALADELGFTDCFCVMFAGNMGDLQGLDVAVRAAAAVRDLSDFRLTLVGDGLARPGLEALARELEADNVMFLPSQPLARMRDVTSTADVQLVCLRDLPFLRGTIPSKLGTVLATGLPVLCSAGGDAPQLVVDAGAGWTCRPDDAASMEQAFRQAHSSSLAERTAMAAAGRRYYQTHLSRAAGTEQIIDALERAAGTA